MRYPNLGEMMTIQAKRWKNKPLVYFEDKVYTYMQVEKMANKAARMLKEKGLKKGDKVAVIMENSAHYIISLVTIFKAGAVAIPVNNMLRESEFAYILNDSYTKFVFLSDKYAEHASYLKDNVASLEDVLSWEKINCNSINVTEASAPFSDEPLEYNFGYDDLAFFVYTSGTTGHPKGAMLSHGNMLSDAKSIDGALKWHPSKKFLLFLPIFHSYTLMTSVLYPIYLGCSIIMFASVMELKTKKFRQTLIFKRPRVMVGVPQIYQALIKAQMPKWFIKLFYPIQLHISGGAPISADTLDAFEKKFGVPIVEGYGLSEAAPVVAVNTVEYHRADSVGKPMPGIQVKIVDEEENEVPVGEVGELIVKGGNVMKGYYHMPKATDDAIRNGWLFTGDFAKLDEDGFIYIVDRKKDLIISKGMNVYPREVEDVIKQLDGIEAVAVIGAPIEGRDEMILAYVMKSENSNITVADIKAHLKERLASFKTPKHIFIVDELPLTATGKVLKRELKAKVLNGEFKID